MKRTTETAATTAQTSRQKPKATRERETKEEARKQKASKEKASKAKARQAARDPLLDLSAENAVLLKREDFPGWLAPMLATLTEDYFSDEDWLFERKLDGVRLIAYKHGDDVKIYSRNKILQNNTYPEVVDAIARQPAADLVLDGEVVAFAGKHTSFARLQDRLGLQDPEEALARGVDVDYYVFDVLHLEGYSTRGLPLLERKALLRRVLAFDDTLKFTEHRLERGERFLKDACGAGWEGLIAKRAASAYDTGRRSRDWLKFKCSLEQEFVIGGFTEPQGSRSAFGALLLGYFDLDGKLRYAGKVGTGFDQQELRTLGSSMQRLARKTSPFAERDLREPGAHWIKPQLVCQVGFTEWTDDGKLRHPRYLGLREDKAAQDVRREMPQHVGQ